MSESFDLDPASILDEGTPTTEEQIDNTMEEEIPPVEETPDGETPPEEEDGETPPEGKDDKGDKGEKGASKGDDDIDLRKASKEIQSALSKFRDSSPENAKLAKVLRTALGHDIAYQETFKTPQEARVFKAAVDAIGGPEGLTTLQEQAAFSQELDTLADAGDPKVLDTFVNDFPDGFKKLGGPFLDKLKKLDRDVYASTIQPHLIDNLEAAGVGGVLNALDEAVRNNDTATIQKIAANLKAWYGGQMSAAAKFRTDANNPDREKIDAEWQKINTEKENTFNGQWRSAVGSHASSQIFKVGAPYIKTVPIGQQKAFFQEVINEVDRRLTGDKTYTSQEKALMSSKTRDINKIVAFKNAKIDTLIPGVIEKVAKDFGFSPNAKATVKAGGKGGTPPPVTGAGSTPANPIYIKDKPAVADRDLTVKNAIEFQIAGKAKMKTGPYKGRWVSWRPKAA